MRKGTRWVDVEWVEKDNYRQGCFKVSELPRLLETLNGRGVARVWVDDKEQPTQAETRATEKGQ